MTNTPHPPHIARVLDAARAYLALDDDTRRNDDDRYEAMLDMILDLPADLPTVIHDDREMLTTLCLSMSICPVHFVDYAICFDDDEPDCRVVRMIHPNHDT